ncbi:MAG TPA: glycoside hydrolase family 15 protein [Actinomycetota bacterium]|nr:glycoside hydrolase family 15 protein [Actinomycetota bacterium]
MDIDRYTPIRDHAAIGDGRTIALVGLDGSIDWLCLPDLDSPSVFGSLLDAGAGGAFTLAPDLPFESTHRYVEGTNVLVTEFTTPMGAVRVTDGMTLPGDDLAPFRELARTVERIAGEVPMRWSVTPRFGYGRDRTTIALRHGIPVASAGNVALAVNTWNAGSPRLGPSSIEGRFVAQGDATIAISVASQEPLVLPSRGDVERRMRDTAEFWRSWAHVCAYDGAWRDAVERSALALKLLVFAPSGAVAAAATTSLPEEMGGERNWDYRFCWLRDSAFTVSSFLRLGYVAEADAFFWWLMHASQLTHPRLQVLYGLDGGVGASETQLPLAGYRGSVPVRVGNAAVGQVQLDIYGSLMQAAWVYMEAGRPFDDEVARRLARTADLVCDIWREPDSGIWEVRSEPRHFTHSKMMCWVALDRAIGLASRGHIHGSVDRWSDQRLAIGSFIESRCWSESRRSYVRSAGSSELDASVLLGALLGYRDPRDPRMTCTIDAIRRGLGRGPLLDRYRGIDGLRGSEGAFLACSFWLVEALARSGRRSEASSLMEELRSRANHVGLYSEEIDVSNGEFLGNFPQALSHLALIGAAVALEDVSSP